MPSAPYDRPYEHITDPMRFFRYDASTHEMRFVGETLEVRVPERFQVYDLLSVGETVEAPGLMDLLIDGRYQASLWMMAVIRCEPREIARTTIDGITYLVLHFGHGDVFIKNTQVVKKKSLVYAVYVEVVTRGNLMYWLTYDKLAVLFDQAKWMCDADVGVDPAVFEVIFAHLARDPTDRFRQYRHTDMRGDFELIPLRSVVYAPPSTTARLLGSYFAEGLNAALSQEVTQTSPLENLLRGLPAPSTEVLEDRVLLVDGARRRVRVELYALGPNGTLLASLKDGEMGSLPGGGLMPLETVAMGAARENAEESGWTATRYRELAVPGSPWVYHGEMPGRLAEEGWDEEVQVAVVAIAGAYQPGPLYNAKGDARVFRLVPLSEVIARIEGADLEAAPPLIRLRAAFRLAALREINRVVDPRLLEEPAVSPLL